jgi:hypothetical protein
MLDTQTMLAEIDRELARLTKLRAAIVEAAGGDTGPSPTKSRLSPAGARVISIAAKLKSVRRSGNKTEIKRLEQELAEAKEAARAAKG